MLGRLGVAVVGVIIGASWTACADYDARDPPADAAVVETGTPSDAGTKADVDLSTCCDCDGDGFPNMRCVDASADASSVIDCDDSDPNRHPQAAFTGHALGPGQNGDWNCDGVVEKDPSPNLLCTKAPIVGCVGTQAFGFAIEHACGEMGAVVKCATVDDKCVASPTGDMAVQQCR